MIEDGKEGKGQKKQGERKKVMEEEQKETTEYGREGEEGAGVWKYIQFLNI